jgi:hypothetical protein
MRRCRRERHAWGMSGMTATTGVLGAQTASRGGGHPVWHLLVVAIASVVVFAAIKAWEWWCSSVRHPVGARRASDANARQPWARPYSPLVVGVALASVGCSVTHAAVGPEHFHEATAFGVFFLVASALQAAWAVLIARRADRRLLAIGAAGNAAILVLWAVTRTVGLPIGPEVWHPEAVTAPDLFASLLELIVILGASWLLLHPTLLHPTNGPPGSQPPKASASAGSAYAFMRTT